MLWICIPLGQHTPAGGQSNRARDTLESSLLCGWPLYIVGPRGPYQLDGRYPCEHAESKLADRMGSRCLRDNIPYIFPGTSLFGLAGISACCGRSQHEVQIISQDVVDRPGRPKGPGSARSGNHRTRRMVSHRPLLLLPVSSPKLVARAGVGGMRRANCLSSLGFCLNMSVATRSTFTARELAESWRCATPSLSTRTLLRFLDS